MTLFLRNQYRLPKCYERSVLGQKKNLQDCKCVFNCTIYMCIVFYINE